MNEPSKIGDLVTYLGELETTMKWKTCPKCGREALMMSGKVCFDCDRVHNARTENRDGLGPSAWSIPERFALARFGGKELLERIAGGVGRSSILKTAQGAVTGQRVAITGKTAGCGKTTLACAMLRAWNLDHCNVGRFVSAVAYSASGFTADASLTTCPMLLIDDVGEEERSTVSRVPLLIFERYDKNLPVWITTSRTTDELAKRYGDGFARRIFEGATLINFDKVRQQ